jgi:hypothetical protein
MVNLIARVRELMGPPPPDFEFTVVPLDDQSLARLMRLLCLTREDELSCEEVYNCLDEYVDCLTIHREIGLNRPLVEHHLSFCADCRDELDALIRVLHNVAGDID